MGFNSPLNPQVPLGVLILFANVFAEIDNQPFDLSNLPLHSSYCIFHLRLLPLEAFRGTWGGASWIWYPNFLF